MGIYAVGEVIRRNRESIGMTQEELCDGICSVETLSRIENGRNIPSRANFERLMERMGKTGKKYLPFVRSKDIENHLLREEVERLISVHDYRSAERKLQELEEHLEMEDAVNRQYVLRMKVMIDSGLGRSSAEEQREKLKEALQCTIPDFSNVLENNGNMDEQEMRIICNIAMTYMEEQKYDRSIEILEKLKEYLEKSKIVHSIRIQRLILSNLSQTLGRKGEFEIAKKIQLDAAELARKENNAGSMVGLLYRIGYNGEKMKQGKNICLSQMMQAYVLAQCIDNQYMLEHIQKHIIQEYGQNTWDAISICLENHH